MKLLSTPLQPAALTIRSEPSMKFVSTRDVILLVDDDPVARLLTASVLEQQGFDVVQAGSGGEALGGGATQRQLFCRR